MAVCCPEIQLLEVVGLGLCQLSLIATSDLQEGFVTFCFTSLWFGCFSFELFESGMLSSKASANSSALYFDCSIELFLSIANSYEYKENAFWKVLVSEFQALHKHCSEMILLLAKCELCSYIWSHHYQIIHKIIR